MKCVTKDVLSGVSHRGCVIRCVIKNVLYGVSEKKICYQVFYRQCVIMCVREVCKRCVIRCARENMSCVTEDVSLGMSERA